MASIIPEPENSTFGRQDYWNQFYHEEKTPFSLYCNLDDLEPFLHEFVPDRSAAILLPGVGNDDTLVQMYYEANYINLTAMDYAPAAIARCREMLVECAESLSSSSTTTNRDDWGDHVSLVVADARNLEDVFESNQFDAVMEKGTLDSIYLSGGKDKALSFQHMDQSISELGRCVRPGGTFLSVAGVVPDLIQESFQTRYDQWECLVDKDDLHVTEDGFTSNNIDGTLMVWRKKS